MAKYIEPTQSQILETLQLCQSYLPTGIQPSHEQRLARIREWVIGHHEDLTGLQLSAKEYSFEWIEEAPLYFVSDSPYGKVVILEERSKKMFSYGTTSS